MRFRVQLAAAGVRWVWGVSLGDDGRVAVGGGLVAAGRLFAGGVALTEQGVIAAGGMLALRSAG